MYHMKAKRLVVIVVGQSLGACLHYHEKGRLSKGFLATLFMIV